MTMIGGSVAVNDDGSRTGSGLALALFDGFKKVDDQKAIEEGRAEKTAQSIAAVAALHPPGPERDKAVADVKAAILAMQVYVMKYWAELANSIGPATIGYLQANATVSLAGVVATVGTGASVGRTPTPNNPGAPIVGPAAAVSLPVMGDAGTTTLAVS